MLTLSVLSAAGGETAQQTRPAETELLIGEPNSENAAGSARGEPPAQNLPGVGFGDFLRMILVLGFVIALIYGFVWLLRRFSGQKGEMEDVINLVSTRPLKGDAALHLVELGSKMFLVGSSSTGVNLLSEITDEDTINQIKLSLSQAAVPAAGGFGRMLRERFGKTVNTAPSPSAAAEEEQEDNLSGFLRSQRERLTRL
ncbi:MAG: hypothetical protein CSA76_03030 [Spirochaetales bacterium]|nr:MAG: hypothetical protein CSA76_03030 [Spirochaetales bacterium]